MCTFFEYHINTVAYGITWYYNGTLKYTMVLKSSWYCYGANGTTQCPKVMQVMVYIKIP